MSRNDASIPTEFHSIEEIQNFLDSHSSAHFWDEKQDVDFELAPALQPKMESKKLYQMLGFSDTQITEIEAKAKAANMSSRQLISKLVIEHV